MHNSNSSSLAKAKNYAFLLLKYRLRSENELFERLKRKNFDEDTIKQVVGFLKERSFVDDEAFAKAWIESRISRPLGLRRLKQELKAKGVDRAIIDRQLKEAKEDYPEEEIVRKLAALKFKKSKDIEPRKAKNRIFAYLMRRGFSPEIIIDAINQL